MRERNDLSAAMRHGNICTRWYQAAGRQAGLVLPRSLERASRPGRWMSPKCTGSRTCTDRVSPRRGRLSPRQWPRHHVRVLTGHEFSHQDRHSTSRPKMTDIVDLSSTTIYTSHALGHAKEDQSFWDEARKKKKILRLRRRTVFIDDNTLRYCESQPRDFGAAQMLLHITRPDSQQPGEALTTAFTGIDGGR